MDSKVKKQIRDCITPFIEANAPYKDMADALNKKGFKNSRGTPWTDSAINHLAVDNGWSKRRHAKRVYKNKAQATTMSNSKDQKALIELILESQIPTKKKLSILKELL